MEIIKKKTIWISGLIVTSLTHTHILHQSLCSEIGKWSTFENQILLANDYLDASFKQQHKIIGRFRLLVYEQRWTCFLLIFAFDLMNDVLIE